MPYRYLEARCFRLEGIGQTGINRHLTQNKATRRGGGTEEAQQREAVISRTDDFKTLFSNIAIDNEDTIALRYGEVTRACNLQFRDTESRTANSFQVGSYGRWTGIRGISDLDMLYIMPAGKWDAYKNNPYKLLRDTADAIQDRYKSTTVYVDTLVVVCEYQNFKIEVQPVFEDTDGY